MNNSEFPSVNESFNIVFKKVRRFNADNDIVPAAAAAAAAAEERSIVQSRKKRLKAPIVINVASVLKESVKGQQKDKEKYFKKRRSFPPNTCGNILDSSNPIRKQGKHREQERRKLSSLKAQIIKDRVCKSLNRKNCGEEEVGDVDFKISDTNCPKEEEVKKVESDCKNNETKENMSLASATSVTNVVTKRKFSSKFREYCENALTPDLDNAVKGFIEKMVKLQDRAFERNPIKAKMRKRHVCGLHEISKFLRAKKLKLIIFPPDLERSDALNDRLTELKNEAALQQVPCIYALSRRQLGYVSLKKVPVSGIGILSYDGLNDQYSIMMQHLVETKRIFEELFPTSLPSSSDTEVDIEEDKKVIVDFVEKLKI